ncbi:MAG: hypothetical protein KF690_07525 [Bacteroidetes bacterium]|nr:hypothetical protein [Bacteroidota bacterium]
MQKAAFFLLILCLVPLRHWGQAPSRSATVPASRDREAAPRPALLLPAALDGERLFSQDAWLAWYRTEGYANPQAGALAQEHISGTYAAYYISGMSSTDPRERMQALEKARDIEPRRPEAWQALAVTYELQNGPAAYALHLAHWSTSAARYPAPVMTYAANQLATLPPQAVLLVRTAEDRWPLELARQQAGGRQLLLPIQDVLQMTPLAEKRLKAAGITLPNGMADVAALCHYMTRQYPAWPVFLAMDCNPHDYGMADKCYLTGLAWKYSAAPLDNLSLLQQNWHSRLQPPRFHTQLERSLYPQELRYFYPLVLLAQASAQQGDARAAEDYRRQAEAIARLANRTDLLNYLPR